MDKFLSFLGLCKKSGNLIEGYNKVTENIKKKSLSLVIVSTDASQNTIEEITRSCQKEDIKLIIDYDKMRLGNSVGRTEVKVLGVGNKKFSDNLVKLYEEK